jgi:hypothetical protein
VARGSRRALARGMTRTSIALLLALGLAAGCKKKVDSAGVEKTIRERLEDKGATVDSVSCPKDVKAEVGKEFTCTVEIDGQSYQLEAHITKVEDDRFEYDMEWVGDPPPAPQKG